MSLSDDTEFCLGFDVDCEVNLVSTNETTAVGEKEDEDALLVCGRGGRDELERILERYSR